MFFLMGALPGIDSGRAATRRQKGAEVIFKDSGFGQGKRVKVKDSLLRKVRLAAEISGCTVEEFIQRTLERESEKAISLKARRAQLPPEDDSAVAS